LGKKRIQHGARKKNNLPLKLKRRKGVKEIKGGTQIGCRIGKSSYAKEAHLFTPKRGGQNPQCPIYTKKKGNPD